MIRALSFYTFILFQLFGNELSAQDINNQIFSKDNSANFYSRKVATNYQGVLSLHFKKWETIQISSATIASTLAINKEQEIDIGLQINNNLVFNLALEHADIIAENYILTTQTAQGKITTKPQPDYFYKGKVKDNGGGNIRLCIKDGFIYGSIKIGDKEYFIEPLARYIKAALTDEFIFYESRDVIDAGMSCGYNDSQDAVKNIRNKQSGNSRPVSPDSVPNAICKKVKFVIVTDYSMYKALNNDIDALQTFLLANLNMAEGLYNTLNLDSTTSGDVGNDALKFEVTQMHTSVCDSCDFMGTAGTTGDIMKGFNKWINENTDLTQPAINEFWSTRRLYFGTNGFAGMANSVGKLCTINSINLLRYFTQDPLMLRLQVAHEAGHSLGCQHDNEVSSSVTGFIMNASANLAATRFSRLTDFAGINYSSQLAIRNNVFLSPCIQDCSALVCDAVAGLKINYSNSLDNIKLSWVGNGTYIVKYKIKDSVNFNALNVHTITGNEMVLKNLSPCNNYIVQVQKVCGPGNSGSISSIAFNSSPFGLKADAVNLRSSLYDLKLQLDCVNCTAKEVTVNVDHHPYFFTINQFPSTVIIPDLFADGARHRLDYNGDKINGGCKLIHFYMAPYYRENSVKIMTENFDSCKLPAPWKDSALKILSDTTVRKWGSARLAREISSFDDLLFNPGNFDSTCMLFNLNGVGSLGLFSPTTDISKFSNVYLSFDYKYICYKLPPFTTTVNAFFKVQVFDGITWQDVFKQNQQELRTTVRRTIWDTIPARIFISLDTHSNNKLQVRFVVDDGPVINPNTGKVERALPFLYLDNIKVDGYLKANNTGKNLFSIFPNPAGKDIFIKSDIALTANNIEYKIIDVLGRVRQKEKLINYRIDVSILNKGTYFLMLYQENKPVGNTQKFIKN
ncbi:MAG: T9SS type A sorting domain-containing protein [Ginsengibacter sp.]